MSGLALFLVGSFVTLVTASALALLVYGAILDGRDEADRRRRLRVVEDPPGPRRAA